MARSSHYGDGGHGVQMIKVVLPPQSGSHSIRCRRLTIVTRSLSMLTLCVGQGKGRKYQCRLSI